TTLDLINESIKNYYEPLEGYNMVVEKHGTLVQFVPLDSEINDSIAQTIESDLGLSVHPAAFKFVEETIKSVIPNVLAGFTIELLTDLVSKYQVDGRAPRPGFREILLGSGIHFLANVPKNGENITLFGINFTVVGKVPFENPILDNFLFTTYDVMQSSLRLNGTCNILYVEKDSLKDEAIIEQEIESSYPQLKFLTSDEVDVLSSDFVSNTSSWNSFLIIFTLFISIAFPFSAFFINHDKISKEVRLLRLIGTPRVHILLYKCQENAILFALGLIIGYVLTIFIFPLFTIFATAMQGINYDAWGLYTHTFDDIQPNVFTGFVTLAIYLLGIGPALLLIPYMTTIARVERSFTSMKGRPSSPRKHGLLSMLS
ncbi:MAG: FtsX-like permease family protein, partial [Candidatus Sigynarchaeum springense]